MKIAYEYPEMPEAHNQVTLNGVRAAAAGYKNEIAEGFQKAYEYLLENKDYLLQKVEKECKGSRIRDFPKIRKGMRFAFRQRASYGITKTGKEKGFVGAYL